MIYRPRTLTVEARQWTGEYGELCEWLGYALVAHATDSLTIENRSGRVVARPGDWIVHEDDGFYPMEPALFTAAYEEAP